MAKTKYKYAALAAYHVVLIVIAILIVVFGKNQCVRRDCVVKSNFILRTLQPDSDPCKDFFQYACGNYKNIVQLRRGIIRQKQSFPFQEVKVNKVKKEQIFPFASVTFNIEDNVDKQVRSLLENPRRVNDDRCLKIVRKIYTPCHSRDIIKKQGIRPLWSAILKTGGFPLVEGGDWNEKAFSIAFMEYNSRKIGFAGQHIFQSYVAEGKTPGKYLIHIEPPIFENTPGYEIITDFKTDRTKMDSNYGSMVERLIFHLLGNKNYEKKEFQELRKKYEPGWRKVIELKKALGQARDAYLKLQDPTDLYIEVTLDYLVSEFPYVDWKYYFRNMLVNTNQVPSTVVVIGTSYFKSLNNLLRSTKKDEIANYLVLQNTLDAIRFLPNTYFAIYNKFLRNIYTRGTMSFLSRKQFCADMVKTNLRPAVASLFLEKYNLTQKSQEVLTDIAKRISDVMKSAILNSQWMDSSTKEEAVRKLKFTKFALSLTDDELERLRSEEARSKFYESLCIGTRQTQVLPNYFCLNKFKLMKNWELLGSEVSVFNKELHLFESKIRYDQKRKEFIVPYGILQVPAFSGAWPGYMNYGGVGSRIGQKLSAGYDQSGNTVDHLGFDKASWWSNGTTDNYKRLTKCFADDYVAFVRHRKDELGEKEKNPQMAGNLTAGSSAPKLRQIVEENFASFQGLKLARAGYEDYSKARFLKEPTLPGLEDFSAKQLFYIGFANTNCAVYRPENETSWPLERNEIHAKFQVFGSVKNDDGFQEAFHCKIGTDMNPRNKCKLMW